jgi:hypothetical protein
MLSPLQAAAESSNTLLDLIKWTAILFGCVVVSIFIFKVLLRRNRGDDHGDEFTSMGLKGLYERGVITEEEYKSVRAKMAERVKRQVEEEAARRAAAKGPRLPLELELSQKTEAAQEDADEGILGDGPSRVNELTDLDKSPLDTSPADEPPAPGGPGPLAEKSRLPPSPASPAAPPAPGGDEGPSLPD